MAASRWLYIYIFNHFQLLIKRQKAADGSNLVFKTLYPVTISSVTSFKLLVVRQNYCPLVFSLLVHLLSMFYFLLRQSANTLF
jgi:hypothetical protein